MLQNFMAQPTWPAALATVVAALLTVALGFLLNMRSVRFGRDFQRHSALMAEENAKTAAALADLKKLELGQAAASKYADIIERRASRLHDDLAELLGIVDLMTQTPPADTPEDRRRLPQLMRSISLSISPRSAFAEQFADQLGHVREAAKQGASYLAGREAMLNSLRLNAWKIVDAEYDRALESVSSGAAVERPQLEAAR